MFRFTRQQRLWTVPEPFLVSCPSVSIFPCRLDPRRTPEEHMATLGALIERNIWLIYTPQAAAFVVTAMVVVWGIVLLKAGKHRRPPDTNELVVMLTALYVSVAYLILYPTVATA